MKWQVDWAKDAISALTSFWLMGNDKNEITAAQHRIDQLLAADPHTHAKKFTEGLYVIVCHPLRATLVVDEASRTVRVVGVAWLRPRH
jgi:hypothetical protein